MSYQPFQPRMRIKEAREVFRSAAELDLDETVSDVVCDLLQDLALDLSRRRLGSETEAYHFVIRCMGAMAEAHADDVYEPYGFENPFRQKPPLPDPVPIAPAWKWPVVNTAPSSVGGIDSDSFMPFSALKMFGYTVGRTNGWPRAQREAFLADFIRLELPPIVTSTFGNEYGGPMSTTRLRKMANLIAANASNFYRNDPRRYAAAIADWTSDLDYLKRVFYVGAGLAFHPWPDPNLKDTF